MPNPAPLNYNSDGGVAFGAQDIVISGVTWTAESMTYGRASDWVVQNNSAGRVAKQFGREQVPMLNLTLAWVGATTGTATDGTGMGSPTVAPPAMFATFTALLGGAVITFIIEKVGSVFSAGGEAKVNISARYKLT